MLLENIRKQIIDVSLWMQKEGLIVGTAGNVSAREGDLWAITPSGVPYEDLAPEDIVVCNLEGEKLDGKLKPSSEFPLHLSVYRHTDAQAITHNHAPASTALGLVVDEIPLSHYYSLMFGGPIRVAPYSYFGSDKLAQYVTEALQGRTGALMKNHGAITTGKDLWSAANMLPILEYVCEVQLRAMATGREIALLTQEEVAEAMGPIQSYGTQKK